VATVQQKLEVVNRHIRGESATDLAEEYATSLRSIFRWCKKFDGSLHSLECQSRAPKRTRWKASSGDEALMLELRTSKKYGYRRIKWHFKRRLNKRFGETTIKRILAKHGLAGYRRKHRKGRKHRQARVPNERVLIDFTEKRILKGKRTYTFLAVDSCTRRLFTRVSSSKSMAEAIEFVKRLVKSWGLMKRIQLDNGTQFVYMLKRKYKKHRLRRRTRRKQNEFGAFCKELNIKLKFIPVGRPDKNAEVERAARTLKEECLDVKRFRNLKQVTREVNRFTRFYNRYREHGAHGGDTPLNVWRRKSIKAMPQ